MAVVLGGFGLVGFLAVDSNLAGGVALLSGAYLWITFWLEAVTAKRIRAQAGTDAAEAYLSRGGFNLGRSLF